MLLFPFLETSEQLTPEEEAEETEAWAKPLSQLWQNRPPNFEAEKEFNEIMAQQAPHCAVCMIFQTYHQVSVLCCRQASRTSNQRKLGLIMVQGLSLLVFRGPFPPASSLGQCFGEALTGRQPSHLCLPSRMVYLVTLAHRPCCLQSIMFLPVLLAGAFSA